MFIFSFQGYADIENGLQNADMFKISEEDYLASRKWLTFRSWTVQSCFSLRLGLNITTTTYR